MRASAARLSPAIKFIRANIELARALFLSELGAGDLLSKPCVSFAFFVPLWLMF